MTMPCAIDGAPTSLSLAILAGTISRGDAATRGNAAIELGGRDLELLLCLALHQRPIAPLALISLLWPDADEASGRNALKVRLHRLRKRIGDPLAVRTCDRGYRLGDHVSTDLHALDRIARGTTAACASLDDVAAVRDGYRRLCAADVPPSIADTPTGELFARRVEALKRAFAQRLATIVRDRVRGSAGLEIAYEMIAHDACDEVAWEIAIGTRLAQNDRVSALRDYAAYTRALEGELGLAPSVRIRELIARARFDAREAAPEWLEPRGLPATAETTRTPPIPA